MPSTFVRKCLFSVGGIFAEVGGQVNYDVICADARGIERIEDIELRASRKVFGVEERADVSAEITAAACDKKFQVFESASFESLVLLQRAAAV